MADEHAARFSSPGFTRFFAMLGEELDEEYFSWSRDHLKTLKFKGGMLISAQLAAGNKGRAYTLRRPREQSLLGRVFDRSGYSFTVPERDKSGFRALGDLEDKGVNLVANALAQSVDHVHSFFIMLRGRDRRSTSAVSTCSERLAEQGRADCVPSAASPGASWRCQAEGLYDVCLRVDDRAARGRQRRRAPTVSRW